MVSIEYLDFYQSEHMLDAHDVLAQSNNVKTQNRDYCEFYIKNNRFKDISVFDDDVLNLLVDLLNKLHSTIDFSEIDYLFFCRNPYGHTENGINMPFYILEKYKFNASVINMFQECSTTIQAMEFASGLIQSNMAKKILVLTISHLGSHHQDRYIETSILGDGIGVMLMGTGKPMYRILDFSMKADGAYSYQLKNGQNNYSPMNSLKNCATMLNDLRDNTDYTIKLFVPQNVSYTNLHMVSKYMELGDNNFFMDNLSIGGHMADVDTIRNLISVYTAPFVKEEEVIIAYSIGNMRPGLDNICNSVLLQKM